MRIKHFSGRVLLSVIFIFILSIDAFAQINLTPHKITLKNNKSFNLNLPDNFDIIPAAEGLKRVRFFAKAPDGRIFVTDMYNLADNKRGAVYILDGWNSETGKFASVTPYLTNLRNPNSAAFYKDEKGQDWFYLAETDKLSRRKFTAGETTPSDTNPQTLATFPDYGLSYKYGGWHLTRTIAFSPERKLYISVGSSCNACVEKEEIRAAILEMNPDGSNQRFYARGLRNSVDLKWVGKFLFATNQGSDHLGLNKPDETFYALKDGTDYGWPSCYQSNGKVFTDPKNPGKSCQNVPASYSFFPAHSSALGFDYFDNPNSDTAIKGSFLVSLHGSTNKSVGSGYKIVIIRKGEKNQDFANGFLQGPKVLGRPCGIMKLDENSFLFTDDYSGVVYYVRKKGWTTQIAANSAETKTSAENLMPPDADQPNENKPENANVSSSASPAPANSQSQQPQSKSCFGMVVVILSACLQGFFMNR